MTSPTSREILNEITLYRSEGSLIDHLADMGDSSKRMLVDSINRTLLSYNQFAQCNVLKATGNFLLGRIQSAASAVIVFLSASTVGVVLGAFAGPAFLAVIIPMNLFSRLPGVSYFQAARDFTQMTSDAICRTIRVYVLALPIISLFLSASCINLTLPGLLKSKNIFFNIMAHLANPLGPRKTLVVVVPGNTTCEGTEEKLSALSISEEFLRSLSPYTQKRVLYTYRLTLYTQTNR